MLTCEINLRNEVDSKAEKEDSRDNEREESYPSGQNRNGSIVWTPKAGNLF